MLESIRIDQICLLVFIVYSMTTQEIFFRWRELFRKSPTLYYLVHCPYCFSFWVALAVLPWDYPTILITYILANIVMAHLKSNY